ncbi:MAG: hypothetical protein GY737_16165 [Desulfobacteraceae bacterium]|nr:hypothetical protein [Desulfobacteraceae bacterium]
MVDSREALEKSPAREISKLEENNVIERYPSARETESLLRELKRFDLNTAEF